MSKSDYQTRSEDAKTFMRSFAHFMASDSYGREGSGIWREIVSFDMAHVTQGAGGATIWYLDRMTMNYWSL